MLHFRLPGYCWHTPFPLPALRVTLVLPLKGEEGSMLFVLFDHAAVLPCVHPGPAATFQAGISNSTALTQNSWQVIEKQWVFGSKAVIADLLKARAAAARWIQSVLQASLRQSCCRGEETLV